MMFYAPQMAGWRTKIKNSSILVYGLWRIAGPSAFVSKGNMLKSDKISCLNSVVNCIRLRTFWTPLVANEGSMLSCSFQRHIFRQIWRKLNSTSKIIVRIRQSYAECNYIISLNQLGLYVMSAKCFSCDTLGRIIRSRLCVRDSVNILSELVPVNCCYAETDLCLNQLHVLNLVSFYSLILPTSISVKFY